MCTVPRRLLESLRRASLLALALHLLAASPCRAELPTEAEFRSLAARLAPKINLFREIWSINPEAEFFGGTVRDYLYWLRGEFRQTSNRAEVVSKMAELDRRDVLDIKDFVVGESDVDVVSSKSLASVDAGKYRITKIDLIDRDRFDPKTDKGETERKQGHIPIEKIRLGRHGLIPFPEFGDGAHEIYEGRISVKFPNPKEFKDTFYARIGLNHPVLLVVRYVRLLAMDYYYTFGAGVPDPKALLAFDARHREELREIVKAAIEDPEFAKLVETSTFASKLNRTIQKAFRSYTNPTATMLLFNDSGLHDLVTRFEAVHPINQFLFAQPPRPEEWRKHFAEYGVAESEILTDAKTEFKELVLFHGTRTEPAFRSILFEGVMPSEAKNVIAGEGLYGVQRANIDFAIRWGDSADRVVQFNLKPEARLIDITQGKGQKLFEEFKRRYLGDPSSPKGQDVHDAFSDYFGADLLRYPYQPTAYVVKNSDVLSEPKGVNRSIMSVGKLMKLATETTTPEGLDRLRSAIELNVLSGSEIRAVARSLSNYPDLQLRLKLIDDGFRQLAPNPTLEKQLYSLALTLESFRARQREIPQGRLALPPNLLTRDLREIQLIAWAGGGAEKVYELTFPALFMGDVDQSRLPANRATFSEVARAWTNDASEFDGFLGKLRFQRKVLAHMFRDPSQTVAFGMMVTSGGSFIGVFNALTYALGEWNLFYGIASAALVYKGFDVTRVIYRRSKADILEPHVNRIAGAWQRRPIAQVIEQSSRKSLSDCPALRDALRSPPAAPK